MSSNTHKSQYTVDQKSPIFSCQASPQTMVWCGRAQYPDLPFGVGSRMEVLVLGADCDFKRLNYFKRGEYAGKRLFLKLEFYSVFWMNQPHGINIRLLSCTTRGNKQVGSAGRMIKDYLFSQDSPTYTDQILKTALSSRATIVRKEEWWTTSKSTMEHGQEWKPKSSYSAAAAKRNTREKARGTKSVDRVGSQNRPHWKQLQ